MSCDKGTHTPVTFTLLKIENIYISWERFLMPISVTLPAFISGNQYLPEEQAQEEFDIVIFVHSVIS